MYEKGGGGIHCTWGNGGAPKERPIRSVNIRSDIYKKQ
jgi:hypothetical protein